jgi:hypothetical protein
MLAARHDQRLVHQRRDHFDDPCGITPERAHLLGAVRRGAAAEDRQAPQDGLLATVEQVPAPVHDRAQRLVPGQRASGANRQQREPVIEPVGHLSGGQCPHPHRGKLDSQRDPVKIAADPHH